jgi:hypothetical protein
MNGYLSVKKLIYYTRIIIKARGEEIQRFYFNDKSIRRQQYLNWNSISH